MTATIGNPNPPIPGRSIGLTYDGQGNRKKLMVDGQDSHTYSPGLANEYTAISYGEHSGSVSGTAVNPGTVVVEDAVAQRQGALFYRGFAPGSTASWFVADVFAAAQPAPGNYVEEYEHDTKEVYLPPSSVAPQYDAAGNLLNDGWWIYVYDGENRLIRMTSVAYRPGVSAHRRLDFAYDYLGRRVRKIVRGEYGDASPILSDTAFAYWDWHLIGEVDILSESLKRHYAWGLDKEGVRPGAGGVGGLLMLADHSEQKTYLAMNDYLGNVIGLVDGANGSVAAIYEYDPFGRPIRETGTYAAENPFRFSSQYTDHESGLVYFGFRYYHPQWGRFLNRDPIEEEGGENLYRFVSNDPVNEWDHLGLFSFRQFAKGAISFAAGSVTAVVAIATAPLQAATGIGIAALVVESTAAAGMISYGVGNMVAAFSDDEEKAQAMENSPSSALQLVGRAVGGQTGQDVVALGEGVTGLTGSVRTLAKALDDGAATAEKVGAVKDVATYVGSHVDAALQGELDPYPGLYSVGESNEEGNGESSNTDPSEPSVDVNQVTTH